MERKEYLLRQVLKMFKIQRNTPYVKNMEEMLIVYDGVECDGLCLCEDIMEELDIEDLDDIEDEEIID